MFSNVGNKIKVWAQVECWCGIVISIILGAIWCENNNEFGVVIMIVGAIISWISSLFLYGFGEIITLLQQNVNQQKEIITKMNVHAVTANETPQTVLQDIETNLPEM